MLKLLTEWILRGVWNCRHKRLTMPIRLVDGIDRASCLDCGKLLDYRELTHAEWLN